MKDLKNHIDVLASIKPAVYTASQNGTGVDLRGFDGAVCVFESGTVDNTDTDETYSPKVQESDDNSTYTDVVAADLEGTLALMVDDQIQRVGYKGNKRYIRNVMTLSGTTPSFAGRASIVRGIPHQAPVS
ncbi:MAG: hypothetical protein HOF21_03225 [Nitrospina sp.]|nr:hypothetical protein [Nitrospina sp.]